MDNAAPYAELRFAELDLTGPKYSKLDFSALKFFELSPKNASTSLIVPPEFSPKNLFDILDKYKVAPSPRERLEIIEKIAQLPKTDLAPFVQKYLDETKNKEDRMGLIKNIQRYGNKDLQQAVEKYLSAHPNYPEQLATPTAITVPTPQPVVHETVVQRAQPQRKYTRRQFVGMSAAAGGGLVLGGILNWLAVAAAGGSPPPPPPTEASLQAIPPPPVEPTTAVQEEAPAPLPTSKPLAKEIPMQKVASARIINAPPAEINPEVVGNAVDIGSAFQLAQWGDSRYQKKFLDAYLGENVQTSVQMNATTDGKALPPIYSWIDFNQVDPGWEPNRQFIINKNPKTKETTFEETKYQENIKLPNGETINGIKVYDHLTDEVGVLEKIWLTTVPENFSFAGFLDAKLNPEVLAKSLGKIYVIVDNQVQSYDPKSLFAQSNPYGAKYENGGFNFNPLLSYKKNAKVYLVPNPPVKGGPRVAPIWYKVAGQEFRGSALNDIPETNATNSTRGDFLKRYKPIENSIPQENFPIQEREVGDWKKVIEDEGSSLLTFRVASLADLKEVHFEIKYPESGVPPLDISLQELIGTGDRTNLSLSNRFISVSSDPKDNPNGGIRVKFNQTLPLPKGTEISVNTHNAGNTSEVFWQHRPEFIGDLRMGIFHQKLDRKSSLEGKQIFNTLPQDFVSSQMMVYLDNPAIDVDGYNKIVVDQFKLLKKDGFGGFKYGFLEGNIYIVDPDGTLRPLVSGIEDLGLSGFYGWIIKPEAAAGGTHGLFYYAKGECRYVFNPEGTRLVEASYDNKDDTYALAFNNSPLKLEKGSRLMVMPGFGPFESASVALTLFGYYRANQK